MASGDENENGGVKWLKRYHGLSRSTQRLQRAQTSACCAISAVRRVNAAALISLGIEKWREK
jgi:hypothetical protein